MPAWIFQGNPDKFDIDRYLSSESEVLWSVGQEHLAQKMIKGDEVFMWRAAGRGKEKAGIVARGHLTGSPAIQPDDAASRKLWKEEPPELALRVAVRIEHRALGSKEVVQRDWLKQDPIVSNMKILAFANQTNYLLSQAEAQRLRSLVENTGRDWSRDESLAGLWAFVKTKGSAVSQLPGQPVPLVSLRIGRAVSGVYNKVMNFRAIDPTDRRVGLRGVSEVDRSVWNEFFDTTTESIDEAKLEREYKSIWDSTDRAKPTYQDFGYAPDDDPDELRLFAARVRKGQPAFRKSLLAAYGYRCAISGTGPAEVLEAAHIVSHADSGINALDNGILIRADLHHLFDARLLDIEPNSFTIAISPVLEKTDYGALAGVKVRPREDGTYPDKKYLLERMRSKH